MNPQLVHYVPLATTIIALVFAWTVLQRWRERRSGPHLLWWAAGVMTFAVGTFTEGFVTLFGWNAFIFRSWYIAGALLGGAPMAQGTVYLLLRRRTANILTAGLVPTIMVAALCVLASPLDLTQAEPFRLSGDVLVWYWVRLFSPFINTYALIYLVEAEPFRLSGDVLVWYWVRLFSPFINTYALIYLVAERSCRPTASGRTPARITASSATSTSRSVRCCRQSADRSRGSGTRKCST